MQTRDFYLRSHPLVPVDDRSEWRRRDDEIIGAFWFGFGTGAVALSVVALVAWFTS